MQVPECVSGPFWRACSRPSQISSEKSRGPARESRLGRLVHAEGRSLALGNLQPGVRTGLLKVNTLPFRQAPLVPLAKTNVKSSLLSLCELRVALRSEEGVR
jgi:hypothetical protein